MSLVLAVDLGTSAVKAAVIDQQGRTVSEGKAPQRVLSPDLGAREHDPRHTWQATRRAISSALSSAPPRKRPVGGVVVTGPRGTFCFMDKVGRPLTNFVTWQDQRGAALADELSKRFDPSRYQKLTGMACNPFSALSKVLWMLQNHPDLGDVAASVSTPQGHVLRELGATIDAAATLDRCPHGPPGHSATTLERGIDRRFWPRSDRTSEDRQDRRHRRDDVRGVRTRNLGFRATSRWFWPGPMAFARNSGSA